MNYRRPVFAVLERPEHFGATRVPRSQKLRNVIFAWGMDFRKPHTAYSISKAAILELLVGVPAESSVLVPTEGDVTGTTRIRHNPAIEILLG